MLKALKLITLPVQCLVKVVGVWMLETACAAVKTSLRATSANLRASARGWAA